LAEGVTYHYKVKAVNCGALLKDQIKQLHHWLQFQMLPQTLLVMLVSSSQINLGWTDNSNNETGFKIERSLNNSTYIEIATVTANVITYQNNGLSAAQLIITG